MAAGRRFEKHCGAAALALAGLLIAAAACAGREREKPVFITQAGLSTREIGGEVFVEGRYAGRGDGRIYIDGSAVPFRLSPFSEVEVEFENLEGDAILRVRGMLTWREEPGTRYVDVSRIWKAGTAQGRVLEALSEASSPEELYNAGRWAGMWADTYGDQRVRSLGESAYIKGLKIEDLSLGPEDWEGYFRLAEKSRALLGRDTMREFYVREGIRAFVTAQGRRYARTFYRASEKAAELLPDAGLAAELLRTGFEIEKGRSLETTGDYYEIAEKAGDLFGKDSRYYYFLSRAIRQEISDTEAGDYMALYELARKVREIYPDYDGYVPLVTRAVVAEKSAMDASDPDAWCRLGERVVYFLDDTYRAGEYFKRAVRLDENCEAARRQLRGLGYAYYNGSWWRPGELGRAELFERARRLEKLVAGGEVAAGMSTAQVRRALGEPGEIWRSAGGWGVTEQWVYPRPDGTTYVSLIAGTVVSRGTAAGGP